MDDTTFGENLVPREMTIDEIRNIPLPTQRKVIIWDYLYK